MNLYIHINYILKTFDLYFERVYLKFFKIKISLKLIYEYALCG